MSIKTWIDERVGAARVWNRERKENAEARKAHAAMNSAHGHGRFFLLHVPAMATICAAVVEWYWAILFCVEATGRLDWNYETSAATGAPATSVWDFAFSTHWPVFVGLVCATVPIVMLSMVWLPVQFAMRGAGRWRRGSVIAVGVLANILVIVSGTVVMNYNRQDQVREALVVEQSAQQGRAAIEAQIAAVNGDLERLTDRRVNNEYAATAANVGAVAYRAQYMNEEALARSPVARRDIIVRALGAAERADALRAERAGLFQQLALAPTQAAVAANVEDRVGAELNTFAQYVEVWRPPFIAVICTLIGIFGAWWVLALMQGLNPRDIMKSGWADKAHRIEDLRDQEEVVASPMVPVREEVFDAETGERLVKVKGAREHFRKAGGKKGRPQKIEIAPDIAPSERGVDSDGGNRAPVTPETEAAAQRPEPAPEPEIIETVEPDEPSEADIAAYALVEPAIDTPDADEQHGESDEPDQEGGHTELPDAEGVMLAEQEREREPGPTLSESRPDK